MNDVANQMGLFEIPKVEKPAAAKKTMEKAESEPSARQQKKPMTKQVKKSVKAAPVKVSGLVPDGDVRLTANIRQDLHLKLKIAAAHKRTTIGEIIENLIVKYV